MAAQGDMALRGGPALLLASLMCCLGSRASLSSSTYTPIGHAAAAGEPRLRGSVCAFAPVPLRGQAEAASASGGRPRSACAARGALRLVCLNNESRRPKGDERFCLPHSRFEGKFVPIQEQMTFRAEMEALDELDEAERRIEARGTDEDNIDMRGDVTFGLRIEMSAGFSKRSVEARLRWKCPEYREKVIRKREDGPCAYLPVAAPPSVQDDAAAAPPSGLPRLHDLLQSDMVSWRPDSGGWVGSDTLQLAGKKRRGAAAKTVQARRRNSH